MVMRIRERELVTRPRNNNRVGTEERHEKNRVLKGGVHVCGTESITGVLRVTKHMYRNYKNVTEIDFDSTTLDESWLIPKDSVWFLFMNIHNNRHFIY